MEKERNYDNSPLTDPYNVSMGFPLQDNKGNDVFDSEISTVDVGIYSADGFRENNDGGDRRYRL